MKRQANAVTAKRNQGSKREFKSYDELCEICTYFENE
jgi:hypothetical protein